MTNDEISRMVKLYHGTLYRLAFSYTHRTAEAEDICQEAFIKLCSFKGTFPSDSACKAWLIRVTINLSKNLIRSFAFSRTDELPESIPCNTPEKQELLDIVMTLPPKYRAVIYLYYYEDYSVKEIAAIMHSTVSAITTRLSRARDKLKDALLEEE